MIWSVSQLSRPHSSSAHVPLLGWLVRCTAGLGIPRPHMYCWARQLSLPLCWARCRPGGKALPNFKYEFEFFFFVTIWPPGYQGSTLPQLSRQYVDQPMFCFSNAHRLDAQISFMYEIATGGGRYNVDGPNLSCCC